MGFKKYGGITWQPINPKKLKGIPYTGTLPAMLTGTKAGYLQRYKIYGSTEQTGSPTPENPIEPQECGERTENLFDVEPRMLDASNWTMAGSNFAYFMYYLLSENTVNRLKRIGTIAGTVYLIAGGTYFNGVVLAITSSIKATGVSTEERLLQNDGTPMQYSADVSGYSDIYLCIGYGSGITPSNEQMIIDSIFDNYNIMLNAGTVPHPYEPYGYKLPLTSGSTPVDIYIGDDTLSDEEYVDSGTGKIYRRPNLYDINATDTSKGYLSESYLYGNTIGSNPNWFVSEYMPISANTDYVASGLIDVGTSGVIATINIYDNNKQLERYKTIDSSGDTEINSGVNGAFIRISARNEHKNTVVVKTKNAVPTDPPVPFPQIPTAAGSTTISWVGEGLAPSEFDSIQEWVDTPTYTYTNGAWVLKKWSYIKALVNAGVHQQYFQLGDQLTCTRGNNTIVWDIVDMTATDMTLLMHDCPFNLQFDSVEAMFAFDGGLAAGTYHFTITNQPWYAGDVGKVVQFTLTEPIPAGGQLVVQNNSSATMIGAKINSYASGSSDTVIESATMSEGSDGTDLGSLTDAGDPTNGINSVQRGLRGNSRWSTSAIRQFLNSDGAEGSVWTPQTPFGRLPSWASSQAGFKNGLEADFLSAITPNTNTTVLNTVSDGGGVETTTDMFYLPSRTEIYGTNEISGSPEGSQYDYYIGTDNDAKIKRWNNSAVNWWLRTPISSSANLVRVVNTSGAATNYNALNTIRVAAACVIRAENA